MKIRALNEPETSNSASNESLDTDETSNTKQNVSKEALEGQCFDKYRRALIAAQELRTVEARELLEELNQELDEFKSNNDLLNQLRFSVLKNLGNLSPDDTDHFVKALELDPTDICLWINAGDRSARQANFSFARLCFEQALQINPNNWIAIDRLIDIYYILHLPFELFDICTRALSLDKSHNRALVFEAEARKLQPSLGIKPERTPASQNDLPDRILSPLNEFKRKRRHKLQEELNKFKKTRLSITLDTARTQSLSSFGSYIIKVYERFAKQGLNRNSLIDITLNNSVYFSQQFPLYPIPNQNSQSQNQNSNEAQNISSQDVEMAIEAEETSVSDEKSNNRNEPTTSNDDNEQIKNDSRSKSYSKSSSLSFAAMLFPMDLGDKRRSSRNRSNQDDTFSFKMKFDELNELLPECLRIGAIEQVLQQRREEQQKSSDQKETESTEEPVIVETNLEPVREDLIIKDIIESISSMSAASGSLVKNDIKLCDVLYLYLSKLAAKKQNTLPNSYLKIYKIYRKLCPLPKEVYIDIGPNGLSIDEIWFTLTANEISYQPLECVLLLRLLDQLSIHLDDLQHKSFLVRLFLILGTNSDHRYLEAALHNIEEETRVYASNRKIITRAHIKTLIDRNNEKLLQETDKTDDSVDIINKLAPKSENEMSDREISSLCAAICSANSWQRGLDILNQRNDLGPDIIIETINECLKNGAKMDAILASKLCKDAITGSRPTTWTCLFRGWAGLLTEEEMNDDETVEKMDKFFELGHQTLGKKYCCVSDKGEFLMLYVKHLLEEGDNMEERELRGAMSCLFNYPNKKPTNVSSHKSIRVSIIWEYAQIIYPYLAPEELPTYMSLLRKVGLTSELESVFREIVQVIPDEFSPFKKVHIIENFINFGKPLETIDIIRNDVTKDIYYCLADYYFKNKDFGKAKEFYSYDLVLNPERFDSWAASGLIRANGIDKALSEGTVLTEDYIKGGSFHDQVDSTIRCFEQATKLKPNEAKATLWIEFGNLTYNLASLGSRLFCYDDFQAALNGKETSEIQSLKLLEERHSHLYSLAKRCFKSANTKCHSEEIWLQYYMLGKIYEKVDTFEALDYFLKADAQLYLEGAYYPKKISYHNPPDLAYEAMEVHYRIHSSALKFLFTCQDVNQDHMNRVRKILLSAQRSPFVEYEGLNEPKSVMQHRVEHDVGVLVTDLVDTVSADAVFDELIFMCLHGMKRCLVRCDKNFKALYRLSYYYLKIGDAKMAQDILVSRELQTDRRIKNLHARQPGVPEFRAAPPDLRGIDTLFKDRKIGNLFCNIWRIPVEEVDRPGSFEHWMFKCTELLIKTCIELDDTNILSIIAFQLSRQPEASKKYLHDRSRVLLATFAVMAIEKIIISALEFAESPEDRKFLVTEALSLADKFIKSNVFVDRMRDLHQQVQSIVTVGPSNSTS